MTSSDWLGQLKDVVDDLTTLEINTIEAAGMTGRKMPPWPHALIDIAQKYADFLTGKEVRLDLGAFKQQLEPLEGARREAESMRSEEEAEKNQEITDAGRALSAIFKDVPSHYDFALTNGEETFALLRWAAARTLEAGAELGKAGGAEPPALCDRTRAILIRIQRSSDQIKLLVQQLRTAGGEPAKHIGKTRAQLGVDVEAWPRLSVHSLTLIRKTWDVGTDRILLQTVVQLDGDVVFRAGRDVMSDRNHAFTEAHDHGVHTALDYWKGMFDLVVGLIADRKTKRAFGE